MSRDFDAEMAAHGRELIDLRTQIRDATDAWLDAAAPYFESFWNSYAKSTVVAQSEHSQAISASKVQALRGDVEALAATSRVYTQRRIVDERHDRWPHLAPQMDPDDHLFGGHGQKSDFYVVRNGDRLQTPRLLGHIVGTVLADVYDIVRQYGFSVPSVSQFSSEAQSIPAHSHRSWTPEMVDTIEKYAALHDK